MTTTAAAPAEQTRAAWEQTAAHCDDHVAATLSSSPTGV